MRMSAKFVCLMRNQNPSQYLDWYMDRIQVPTKRTMRRKYRCEGKITAEIRRDLLKLGWKQFKCDDYTAFLIYRATWPEGEDVSAPVSPRIVAYFEKRSKNSKDTNNYVN